MPSGMVPVYCHMSSHGLGACGGGGWTLVMKTDGNKVSHDNQLFVVCRNMYINIFLIRIVERIVTTSFVPSRVVRDIWILNFKFLSGSLSTGNSFKFCFLKTLEECLWMSWKRFEKFRMLSKQIYLSKLSTNCFSKERYVNNVYFCNFPHICSLEIDQDLLSHAKMIGKCWQRQWNWVEKLRIGQHRFVIANFWHIGGNGNGVTCFNFPARFVIHFLYHLLMFLLSQRFTSLPNSGATRSTSTFQEERLCLTIMRQSYQPTGTHRSLRYVSVWRSDIRQDSLPSPSTPHHCTHWLLMVITAPPHWVETRGSRFSVLLHRYSQIVTKKGSTL